MLTCARVWVHFRADVDLCACTFGRYETHPRESLNFFEHNLEVPPLPLSLSLSLHLSLPSHSRILTAGVASAAAVTGAR
eukprot:2916684-Rhodomonas_salina.1